MSHFLIVFDAQDRIVDNTDLMACLSDQSLVQGGQVLAEGFHGGWFQIGIEAMEAPARFLDAQSAVNAIHYLKQAYGEEEGAFQVVPEGAELGLGG